jgi:1-hydroxy-2-isopentenylcarotenoid 3,4-desaturase
LLEPRKSKQIYHHGESEEKEMAKKAVIIGSGINGMATAALLAADGYEVTVTEQLDRPGGVARTVKEDGFLFDMGPTWYLMPEAYERFFGFFGKKPSDYYTLKDLAPSYKMWFSGSETATVVRDLETNMQTFDGFEAGGGEKLKRYLADAKWRYELAVGDILYHDYRRLGDILDIKLLAKGLKLNVFQDLDKHARKYFNSARARKVLEFNTVFLGCSPFKTPAFYSLMSHVDMTQGVFYPEGGMGSMVDGFRRLAEEQGVKFLFSNPAKRIVVETGATKPRVKGVETAAGLLEADTVISTTDYHWAEHNLLEEQFRNYGEGYWKKKTIAPSTLIIYLGLNRKVPELIHHNFFFADKWEHHFDQIFDHPAWPDDPSYYVGVTSKSDTTVAPDGGENIFLLVPIAPELNDSDQIREAFADRILAHLEGITGTDIRSAIVTKKIVSQRDFAASYNLYQGTALGLAHTLWQTAIFRPRHDSKKVEGLWYGGHNTQPGIGLPMALIGAELVWRQIVRRPEPNENVLAAMAEGRFERL